MDSVTQEMEGCIQNLTSKGVFEKIRGSPLLMWGPPREGGCLLPIG
jgi:hypothetical protein